MVNATLEMKDGGDQFKRQNSYDLLLADQQDVEDAQRQEAELKKIRQSVQFDRDGVNHAFADATQTRCEAANDENAQGGRKVYQKGGKP